MKYSSDDFGVFVNSSDGFSDCWHPWFSLFQKYWPQCDASVYLNTETKCYEHPGLDINCTCVQGASPNRLTWSECLLAGLSRLDTPLVLYMQEDYFLHQPVLHRRILDAVQHMLDNPEIRHIGLTRHGSKGPFGDYSVEWLQTIGPKAKYRISTQAGLWRVETLMSYLVARENGWMFEIYGTWRAHERKECFLTARFDNPYGGPPIDYLHTGIVKGRWLPEIQRVFAENGLVVDFARRGFYTPKRTALRKIETASRLLEHPLYLLRQLF